MKKYLLATVMILVLLITGCGKYSEKDVVKDFGKKVDGAKAYQVKGTLEIVNNDDVFNYDVTVLYKKKDHFKVSLKNKANNHEQIILKNDEGVYVLTPSLNKSFKFQSDWPYNNSQVYLLQSILSDIKSDAKREFKEEKDGYTFTTMVNYPNNRKLVKQKIVLDKKLNVKSVHVLNSSNIPQMKMVFDSIDLKASFDDKQFDLEEIMRTVDITEQDESVSSLSDIIYPLYIPSGTKLTSQDKVEKTNGERVILSFDGEKPFLLVEETSAKEEDLTVIPTFGEPYFLSETIGAISENSISWSASGIDYYIVSDVMSQEELIEIAQSVNVIPTMK